MIEELLLKYKGLTEAIIVNIKNDLDGEDLIKQRGEILIELLENKTLDKEEIKKLYIKLDLKNLDKTLEEEINKAIEINKVAIKDINIRKTANVAYGKNININNTFNRKI